MSLQQPIIQVLADFNNQVGLNSRKKGLNVFGDLSLRDDYKQEYFNTRWAIPINNEINETNGRSIRKSITQVKTGSIGFDWNLGKKTSIGGLFNVFDRKWDMDALSNISRTTDQILSSNILMNILEQNGWAQLVGNINLKHEFNKDFSMSIDLDKINFNQDNPTNYFQDFFDNQGTPTLKGHLRSGKNTAIDIFTSTVDFVAKLNDKVTMEFGAKGTFTNLGNDVVVDNLNNGSWIIDNSLTSYATMYENIGAGYTSATIKATEKLNLQVGLRYEHTITNIDTRTEENVVDRNYGKWFPSIFLNNKINDNNSWVVSYSRRIARPSFFQLAPFVLFSDPNSFFSGNVALLPSFTDAFKMEYRYKSVLASLQYSHDKNSISIFQPRINADNKQVSIAQNLDYKDNYSVVLSFPITVTKWWEINLNGIGSLSSIRALYLDNPISLSIKQFSFNGSQKFKIGKSITAELSGFYQSRQLFAIWELSGLGGLDFGLEKKFANSSLRISYSDMLATNKWNFKALIPSENLDTEVKLDCETTVVNVTYTLNFGNHKLKDKKARKAGSKEEQDRLK